MEQTPVISARNLVKRYKDLTAVDGINLNIMEGECFGFLGPNGAGKTTTMRMITCMSPVTEGQLSVHGLSVQQSPREIKSMLGIVSQSDTLDPDLTVYQNLYAHSRYFNIPRSEATHRINEVLDFVHLGHKVKNTPDELSGGMRRRLLIARALLNKPKILVLDEPTTGLDPQSRHSVWDKLALLKNEGITTLLTTHHMEEASYLCDRLVVIDHGNILVQGTPGELVLKYVGNRVLEIHPPYSEKATIVNSLRNKNVEFEDRGNSVSIYDTTDHFDIVNSVTNELSGNWRPANLEDLFLRLTGRALRDDS